MAKSTKSSELKTMIARRLRAARMAYDENGASAARALGYDPQVLNKYEKGHLFPDELFVVRFCALTGCTADWIYLGRITADMPPEMAARIGVFDPELVGAAPGRLASARVKQPA